MVDKEKLPENLISQNHPQLEVFKGSYQKQVVIFNYTKGNTNDLREARVMDYKKITIRKGSKEIQIHILTFNKSIICKEIKIRYCLKKVKQYILTPLFYFKCQIYRPSSKLYEDL